FFIFFHVFPFSFIYTLSLHDALPISCFVLGFALPFAFGAAVLAGVAVSFDLVRSMLACKALIRSTTFERGASFEVVQKKQLHQRSEEHTSELQSRENLVCRLLLEKKK